MGRKKYNEGSSINLQKNYKSINDFNIGVSGSVSGGKGNIYSQANLNISSPTNKWSAGVNRAFSSQGKPQTSVNASYKPNRNSEIKYQQSGSNRSLTYTKRF